MFVKVHKPVNTPCVCDNKDRCRALVEYLLKESLEDKPYYDTFFSHEEDYVAPVTVMQKIDNNHKSLKKRDDKFYMLSINPSQDEAVHLIRKVTGKQVAEFERLTVEEQEKVIHEIAAEVEQQSTQEGERYLTLPDQAAGVKLQWKEKKQHLVWKILFFEVLVCFLMAGIVLERKHTADHIKKEQMKLDYAEVVSKLLILLGAGMSLKQAWNRISAQYSDKRQKKQIKERYIYEEMIITNHEILDGESERLAYQKFGERVDLGEYQRLIRILLQNLQTGSRGLCKLLEQESENALEERKALACKLGEEAGTKMLLPLMMMLGIVIAIIMIPAMLSFQV